MPLFCVLLFFLFFINIDYAFAEFDTDNTSQNWNHYVTSAFLLTTFSKHFRSKLTSCLKLEFCPIFA